MEKYFGIAVILIFSTFLITANETENVTEQNVTEQLEICVEEYNYLLNDFRNGTNCGTKLNFIQSLNEYLAEERDICREEIGAMSHYKFGFFFLLFAFVIIIIIRKWKN